MCWNALRHRVCRRGRNCVVDKKICDCEDCWCMTNRQLWCEFRCCCNRTYVAHEKTRYFERHMKIAVQRGMGRQRHRNKRQRCRLDLEKDEWGRTLRDDVLVLQNISLKRICDKVGYVREVRWIEMVYRLAIRKIDIGSCYVVATTMWMFCWLMAAHNE